MRTWAAFGSIRRPRETQVLRMRRYVRKLYISGDFSLDFLICKMELQQPT